MKVPLNRDKTERKESNASTMPNMPFFFLENQDSKMKLFYLRTQVMLNYILINKSKHNTE